MDEYQRRQSETVIRRRGGNTIANRKKDKRTYNYLQNILHIKIKSNTNPISLDFFLASSKNYECPMQKNTHNVTYIHGSMQSVSFTSKIMSSNPAHAEVYSIQHYMINLSVTCCRSIVFSMHSGFFLHKTTDPHHLTELSLKVALNTISS